MRQHVAIFSNFVCRFGAEKVLLDYAEQIVLPAFFDDTLIRSYGKTQFFFYETEMINLNDSDREPILGIGGRFIKDTSLTREQIFDPGQGIVQDEASIASAPSAFFVLVLNNHRLIYFPETAHAPDLSAFRGTVLSFLKRKRKEFVDRTYEELRECGEKTTKKHLYETHADPTLEIIPISSDEQVENFVKRYKVLKKIEFRLVTPNDEVDGEDLFGDIREYFGALKPESTKIETRSSEGLDTDKAVSRIKAATATANQEVRLSGVDQAGNNLKGDNHQFRIEAPVDTIPPTKKGLSKKLFGIYEGLVASGSIQVGNQPVNISQKIRSLLGLL